MPKIAKYTQAFKIAHRGRQAARVFPEGEAWGWHNAQGGMRFAFPPYGLKDLRDKPPQREPISKF